MNPSDVFIVGSAVSLPNNPVDNDHIEPVLGEIGGRKSRAKRIVLSRNGIEQRYYALDPNTRKQTHTNAKLTAEAIRGLFQNPSEIHGVECLATGTTIPDQMAPNHAVMVHAELGIDPCEVVATSGICLSGMSALKYAYFAIKSGEYRRAVATGSEVVSPVLRACHFGEESNAKLAELQSYPEVGFDQDFLRWMLSDGAGAFLLANKPESGAGQLSLKIEWLDILSFANQLETCMYMGATKREDGSLRGWADYQGTELLENSVTSIKQDVRLLNENIVSVALVQALGAIAEKRSLRADDIDYFVPHISSMYFYQKVQAALDEMDFSISQEKWFTNLPSKGNTGAASIYIMLDELFRSGRLNSGDRILCFVPESGRFSSAFMLLTVV